MSALLDCGVTCVCSLMEPAETDHGGRCFEDYRPAWSALARSRGREVRSLQFPIRDVSVPSMTVMTRILDALDAVLESDGVVYLHCRGGRGRTGAVLGCWLARHGESDALGRLSHLTAGARAYFPRVPETAEQRRFVSHWRTGL